MPVAGKIVVAKKGVEAAKGIANQATKTVNKVANVQDLIKNAEKKISVDGLGKSAKENIVNKAKESATKEER